MADTFVTLGFDRVYELYDDDAERSDIVAMMSGLSGEVGPNDLVVVYFAGHGMLGADNESYLLPMDSTTDIARSGISMQYLKETALGLEVQAVLYLVDACLSGSMMRRVGDSTRRVEDEFWKQARRDRVVQVISAGTAEESALENRRAGLFTAALRGGLVGMRADADRDFVVTTEELARYVSKEVISDSNDRQHPQWGTLEGRGTVLMFDLRHVPETKRRMIPLIPREEIPGMESAVVDVHQFMAEKNWSDAEALLRDLLLQEACSELHLLLAEVYLESGAAERGAFKNRALVERELRQAEGDSLTANQQARLFEIRRVTRKLVRGRY